MSVEFDKELGTILITDIGPSWKIGTKVRSNVRYAMSVRNEYLQRCTSWLIGFVDLWRSARVLNWR